MIEGHNGTLITRLEKIVIEEFREYFEKILNSTIEVGEQEDTT